MTHPRRTCSLSVRALSVAVSAASFRCTRVHCTRHASRPTAAVAALGPSSSRSRAFCAAAGSWAALSTLSETSPSSTLSVRVLRAARGAGMGGGNAMQQSRLPSVMHPPALSPSTLGGWTGCYKKGGGSPTPTALQPQGGGGARRCARCIADALPPGRRARHDAHLTLAFSSLTRASSTSKHCFLLVRSAKLPASLAACMRGAHRGAQGAC